MNALELSRKDASMLKLCLLLASESEEYRDCSPWALSVVSGIREHGFVVKGLGAGASPVGLDADDWARLHSLFLALLSGSIKTPDVIHDHMDDALDLADRLERQVQRITRSEGVKDAPAEQG